MRIPYKKFEDFIEGTNEVFLSVNIVQNENKQLFGVIKMVAPGIDKELGIATHTKTFTQMGILKAEDIPTQEVAEKWKEAAMLEQIQNLKKEVENIRIIEMGDE